MADLVLHDAAAMAQFDVNIRSLVNAEHGARVIALVHRANFVFAPALSMFALNLAYAIKVGGPFVEDRWVHAKPYAKEMKLTG